MDQLAIHRVLNKKTYYTIESDRYYQSATFFKKFMNCEAATMAELKGIYQPDKNAKALLVGNYLHSYFESKTAHDKFIKDHESEMLTQKGTLLKDYKVADSMIATLADDPMFNNLYVGDKETIVKGKIGGVKWKGKIDCLNLERKIFLDLKTTREIDRKYWNEDTRMWQSFMDEYNYPLQMYVYQQLIYQKFGVMCTPYIIAVSKQDIPAKAVISIPPKRMDQARDQIEEMQQRVEEVKNGLKEPMRCGKCAYCRQTAVLRDITSMDDLIS
ncbi:PD-(D/E)XK nuclease-like domain-containing protein [Companilactobacillus sp.]|jgi:hypothetical protein|uniref:PD-(D/E)XK nuclease-like domain-containing protein n=1 Tax=Companilactobacillus sp. TaxID=2767905 RepID=UPI0025BC6E34|nr:PD-(D/E)XK nuclease-like domain-containing protein [Companilactobacillus sp.]MCH4008118.1 PD-(D/E)XK nuclease-like domain-containing protein [Companilactobacillus sp.]MCH4051703.1 PD-(D/E)XK nuclease-like domain-containing protein [Companilactobacillus sp.]MCH4076061.1 PD-(D/E)XK nuclease-like domain-containing protein [Companilactobacillus sp.]MCH4124636.1 PD-(D/E)XK nuclease-like domain-containing protein [Companilactobacillus sp.]MCH4132401.1 PD-(D/E)XK nuclease-like domain-containing pr